jgi:hypothetical protein
MNIPPVNTYDSEEWTTPTTVKSTDGPGGAVGSNEL